MHACKDHTYKFRGWGHLRYPNNHKHSNPNKTAMPDILIEQSHMYNIKSK